MEYAIKIKSISGKVLFEKKAISKPSKKEALQEAIWHGADLRDADLEGAIL